MKKIELNDLIELNDKNELNPVFLYNKQELQDKKEDEFVIDNFFDLNPTTELEKDIYNILSTEKKSMRQKMKENIVLAQFDSKMRRIKNIKSKTYRKIKRQEKIQTMLVDTENVQNNTKNDVNVLTPNDLLEKYESENKTEDAKNIFEFGKEIQGKERKSQVDVVKSIFDEKNDFKDEFNEQKGENIVNEAPDSTKEILPGWGSWGGTDLEVVETKYNTFVKFKDGIECEDRKDFRHSNVIIAESVAKLDGKFIATIPYGYTSEDYKIKMETPVERKYGINKKYKKNHNATKKINSLRDHNNKY